MSLSTGRSSSGIALACSLASAWSQCASLLDASFAGALEHRQSPRPDGLDGAAGRGKGNLIFLMQHGAILLAGDGHGIGEGGLQQVANGAEGFGPFAPRGSAWPSWRGYRPAFQHPFHGEGRVLSVAIGVE
eukprot:6380416-Lingulodinium_polyedra.AAC.1